MATAVRDKSKTGRTNRNERETFMFELFLTQTAAFRFVGQKPVRATDLTSLINRYSLQSTMIIQTVLAASKTTGSFREPKLQSSSTASKLRASPRHGRRHHFLSTINHD